MSEMKKLLCPKCKNGDFSLNADRPKETIDEIENLIGEYYTLVIICLSCGYEKEELLGSD